MRLIDADAADVERIMCYYSDSCRIEDVQEWLDDQPTIDAAPVRRGEWKHTEHNKYVVCSHCGIDRNIYTQGSWNFCPNCGADMRGE
jgi:membrane protease subunit (stomatin/prohibitin family)